ncbi:hypothetical protein [Sulfolobus super-elliptical virus]|nr:hypothetical protein [Sulfolobus super-elliptical virus]
MSLTQALPSLNDIDPIALAAVLFFTITMFLVFFKALDYYQKKNDQQAMRKSFMLMLIWGHFVIILYIIFNINVPLWVISLYDKHTGASVSYTITADDLVLASFFTSLIFTAFEDKIIPYLPPPIQRILKAENPED